jgi:hypothetical protein
MTKITKEQVLENLGDVKKYINEAESEEESIAIKNSWTGNVIFQSTKTTWKEAVEEAVENCDNLHEADLSGADLSGADLYKADLSGANFCEANLSGANFYGANLCEVNLRGANLNGADLQNAKFYGKGGTTRIGKIQVEDFFKALGIIVNE